MADTPLTFGADNPLPVDEKAGKPLTFGAKKALSSSPGPAEERDLEGYLPERPGDSLTNAPDETFIGGSSKNLATTALKGAAHVPGMPGDIVQMALGVGASALAKMPWEERTRQQIEQQWRSGIAASTQRRLQGLQEQLAQPNLSAAERKKIEQHIARIQENPEGLPATGEEIYQASIAPRVGEYTPTSAPGEYFRAAGETAIPSLMMPGLSPIKAATSGATAGLATEAAQREFGVTDPLALASIGIAGAGVPSATSWLTTPIKRVMPMSQEAKEAGARKLMLEQTEDPATALARGKARMDTGPEETLAEATMDPRQAATQEALLVRGEPAMADTANRLRTERNERMLQSLRGMGSIENDPTAVSKGFQEHHEALMRDAANSELPAAPPLNESGAAVQEALQTKNKAAKNALDELKATIDPERKMGMWARDDVTDYAKSKLEEANARPDLKRNPVVDDYLKRASQWGDVKNFSDSMDFVRSLNDDIPALQKSDRTAARDLFLLKKQVQKAQNSALEHQHMWQQEAVARGELAPENTVAHQLNRNVATTREARTERVGQLASDKGAATDAGNSVQRQQAVSGTDSRVETGTGAPGGPQDVPGVGGAKLGEAGRSPDAAGNTGIPLEPLSADAAERLRLFNQGHGLRKDTFENSPAGDVTKAKLGAEAAAKAFVSGPKGYEVGQAVLHAGGPEALANMKDVAMGRLQADLGKKPLDQQTLGDWRTKYGDALRAIDEVEPGFSKQFDTAAGAQQAVRNFENSSAAAFLKLDHPDSVVAHVGSLMSRPNSAELVGGLIEQAKAAPNGEAILGGLRSAGAQWLENNFKLHGQMLPGDVEPVPVIGGAGLKKYIGAHRNTLDALFEPEAVETMTKNADQIDRSVTVRTLQSRLHGSPTAARTEALHQLEAQLGAAVGKDAREGGMSIGAFVDAEGFIEGSREFAGALQGTGSFKKAFGIGTLVLLRRVFANALEKYGVKNKADMAHLVAEGFASRDVGVPMLEKAINEYGQPNQRAFDNLAKALAAREGIGAEAAAQREQERPQRASGGRVGSAKELAERMLEAVEKARKMDVERTKPILKHDDNIVANALAIANRTI